MKYLLKFWDKKKLTVCEEDGEKVKLAKENKIECVRIAGGIYETKAISYVEPIKENKVPLLPERTEDPVKKATLDRVKKEIAERFNWNTTSS